MQLDAKTLELIEAELARFGMRKRAQGEAQGLGNTKAAGQWATLANETHQALIAHLEAREGINVERLIAWIRNPDRCMPQFLCTDSDERQIAYSVWEVMPGRDAAKSLLSPDMPAQELRLHMGELTADEERVARAAIRWANTYVKNSPDFLHIPETCKKDVHMQEKAEAVTRALMSEAKRQLDGHPIPGVPEAIDSWTASGAMSLEMEDMARAAIATMGV